MMLNSNNIKASYKPDFVPLKFLKKFQRG